MKPFVVFLTSSLVLYVLLYRVLIAMTVYGTDEIFLRPEFSPHNCFFTTGILLNIPLAIMLFTTLTTRVGLYLGTD